MLNKEEERKLQYSRLSCWKTIVSGTKFWGVSLFQLNSIDISWAFFGYHFRQITFKTRSIKGFKYLFACNDNLSWYFNFKLKTSTTRQTFFACRFYFPNTDNVMMPRRVSSFFRHFHACTQSQNLLGIGTWSGNKIDKRKRSVDDRFNGLKERNFLKTCTHWLIFAPCWDRRISNV